MAMGTTALVNAFRRLLRKSKDLTVRIGALFSLACWKLYLRRRL